MLQEKSNQDNELHLIQARGEVLHPRILEPLLSPQDIKHMFPPSLESMQAVILGRQSIEESLKMESVDKLTVVVGPCSIHDPHAAMEYATWLQGKREQYGDELELVMRVYFEKPRSTVGWRGLINDPHLDESHDINTGLKIARKLMCDITKLGVPIGSELLDTITPQYLADLMSWGAIGARTTESQSHRELASGVPFAIGFKNGTDGNIKIAVDAITAASSPHRFPSITDTGRPAIVLTPGNPNCHVILRGSSLGTNYDADSVAKTVEILEKSHHTPRVMIDCSHGNSSKNHKKQILAAEDVAVQIASGSKSIMGVMLESNLVEGNQPFTAGAQHEYGKSITDACLNLDDTEAMFQMLYQARKHAQIMV